MPKLIEYFGGTYAISKGFLDAASKGSPDIGVINHPNIRKFGDLEICLGTVHSVTGGFVTLTPFRDKYGQ